MNLQETKKLSKEEKEQVYTLLRKVKYKRFFSENMVVLHKGYYYKTLSFWGKLMHKSENYPESIEHTLKRITKYFWHLCMIVPIEIYIDETYSYIIKQKQIPWEILHIRHLFSPYIREILYKILDQNDQFWKQEGKYLDILGMSIFLKPTCIHNIILYNNTLYLFDFWVLNKQSPFFFFKILSYVFYFLQKYYLYFLLFLVKEWWVYVSFFKKIKFKNENK